MVSAGRVQYSSSVRRRKQTVGGRLGAGACFGALLDSILLHGCRRLRASSAVHKPQILSRRRALPFSSFSVSTGPSGKLFSHSVPGRFLANG